MSYHLVNKILNIHHKEKATAKINEKPRQEFVFNFNIIISWKCGMFSSFLWIFSRILYIYDYVRGPGFSGLGPGFRLCPKV